MGKEKKIKWCIIWSLKEIFQNIVRYMLILISVWASITYVGVGSIRGKPSLFLPFLTLSYFIKHCSSLYLHEMLNIIEENIITGPIDIFKVCLFSTLGAKPLCSNMHCSWGVNTSTNVEEIKNIIKSSVTSPMFILLSCGHGTNDTNGFAG